LATQPPPWPTDTPPSPTETATPTIVWFPATATHTPLPTATFSLTPTLDTSPKYGNLIFSDDFSDPSQWSLGKIGSGSIALGKNELTLAVTRPQAYLYSLRQDTRLGDFYLEITASPSICRGADEYGILIRLASQQDFFRFALLCDGRARLDRLLGGEAASLQPPEMSGAVPRGAPSSSRMAVWAVGKQMLFYANSQYLFTVSDPSLLVGGLGVFARASGEDPVTINFSDLDVYAVQQ
jgi:hypothetical protein